jgi:hypothetical protein
MKYKLMLIDDQIDSRQAHYRQVFPESTYDVVVVRSPKELEEKVRTTPVDAYIVDVFLDQGNWTSVGNADALFSKYLRKPPRPTPTFVVSQNWGDPNAVQIVNALNRQPHVDILRYLSWSEIESVSKAGNDDPSFLAFNAKVLDDLTIWHEKSAFFPADDKPVRILLLADLQYGDPHTSASAVFDENWIVRALKRDNLVPDLVVLAGDISYSGSPDEYQLARKKLDSSLFQYMWGQSEAEKMRDRIIVVPGNHDVNLRFSACSQYDWNRDSRSWSARAGNPVDAQGYALEPFKKFAHELTGSRSWELHRGGSYVDRRFEHIGLRFYLLNSVANLTVGNPTQAEFGASQIEEINMSLGSDDCPDNYYNVAVSHHGIQAGNPKAIQMFDWENVGKQFFTFHKIQLWMYGHYHKPQVVPIDDQLKGIQAPTLKIRPAESVRRGFTLVELLRTGNKVSDRNVYFYQLDDSGVLEKERPSPR